MLKNYENGFYAQDFNYLFTLEDTTALHYDLYMPYTPYNYKIILITREIMFLFLSGYIFYQTAKEKNVRFYIYSALMVMSLSISFINKDNTAMGFHNLLRKMKVAYRLAIIEGTGLIYNMLFLLPIFIILISSIIIIIKSKKRTK